MSNTKKTIIINPELFKIPGSSKTRKNREKKQLTLAPVINPNVLKKKLLSRIKEHKLNETKEFEKNVKNVKNDKNNKINNISYSDEFHGAMNYLSNLSKKQKNEQENERIKMKLNNKTIKTYSSTPIVPNISLELPPELCEPFPFQNNYTHSTNSFEPVIALNYPSDVPYGCLKNGSKPTYRDWIKTRKNFESPDPSIRPPTPPKRPQEPTTQTRDPIVPITSILATNPTINPPHM